MERGQVLVNDEYLKTAHKVYRYSIVEIIHTRRSKKYGHVLWYKVKCKSGAEIYMRYNELVELNPQIK